ATDVPAPPAPYVAHPYTLLQTGSLVGREAELRLLDGWASGADAGLAAARVFTLVALGGMGKSALTWKWFNDRAPEVMRPLAGRGGVSARPTPLGRLRPSAPWRRSADGPGGPSAPCRRGGAGPGCGPPGPASRSCWPVRGGRGAPAASWRRSQARKSCRTAPT